MTPTDRQWLRWSLAFVWLTTAVVSVIEMQGQSRQLLTDAGISDPVLIQGLMLGGALVDAVLGLALLLKPTRTVLMAALLMMGAMTFVASCLAPALWLHPLGPLTKNVPMAVILIILFRRAP